MPVHYEVATKQARMTATLGRIDNNVAPAELEIGTAGMAAVLATIELDKPSFSVGTTGTAPNEIVRLNMLGVPLSDDAAAAAGTAAAARIKDGAGNTIVDGLTVGVTGGTEDILLNSTAISANQQVTLNSGHIQHAA